MQEKKKERASLHKGKGDAQHNEHIFKKNEKNVDLSFMGYFDDEAFTKASFEEQELYYYKSFYLPSLVSQNQKHIDKRQYKRCKSIEEFYKTKRYSPTEEILQYGNIASKNLPTREEYLSMVEDYAKWLDDWSCSHGNHLHVLNWSTHYDETTPHTHLRYVWDYVDNDGNLSVGIEEGLKQSGIDLPYPDEAVGRYNHRNMVFTAMCREKWYDIIESYGYEVEREPIKEKRKHRTVEEEKAHSQRVIAEYEQATEEARRVTAEATKEKYEAQQAIIQANKAKSEAEAEKNDYELALRSVRREQEEAQKIARAATAMRNEAKQAKADYEAKIDHYDDDVKKAAKSMIETQIAQITAKFKEYEQAVKNCLSTVQSEEFKQQQAQIISSKRSALASGIIQSGADTEIDFSRFRR